MPENHDQINYNNRAETVEKTEGFEALPETQIETVEDLEKYVREIEDTADSELSGLIIPEEEITSCNKSVGLDTSTVEQIKIATGVAEGLAEKNTAGTLLRGVFGNKVRAVLAGLMLMSGSGQAKEQPAGTISNTPETVEAQPDSNSTKIKNEDEIGRQKIPGLEEMTKDEMTNTPKTEEKSIVSPELYEELKKAKIIDNLEEAEGFYKYLKDIAESQVKKIREELIQHFDSQDFLDKLIIEYGGDKEKARAVQAENIENLKTVNVDLLSHPDLVKKFSEDQKGDWRAKYVRAFYKNRDHEITSPIDLRLRGEAERTEYDILRHEFIHAATKADVSKGAKKILKDTYLGDNNGFLGILKSNEDKYQRDPGERLVRKQTLDKELEDLGIKKYGEPFTDEHFKKMMEAYKAKKFSLGAMDFIERTKPKYFKDAMDKIAGDEVEEPKDDSIEEIPS